MIPKSGYRFSEKFMLKHDKRRIWLNEVGSHPENELRIIAGDEAPARTPRRADSSNQVGVWCGLRQLPPEAAPVSLV